MRNIRKILALCAAVLFSLAALTSPLPVRADFQVTAQEQVAAINVGWNLGNTLDSYGTWLTDVNPESVETCWGNPVTTRQMIASVREAGFNTIRIPVTWAHFTDSNGNVDPSWMARVKQVVDWSLEEGLYVILNVHHDTGEHGSDKVCWIIADTGTYDSVNQRFANLWTNIANEFKNYDNRLMFEGYNEMLDMNNSWNAPTAGQGAYDAVNSFAQLFVDTVRATGGNNETRNLIVNTYVASADPDVLNHFVLPSDTVSGHLICEIHAYTPWNFCSHDGDASYTTFDSNCQSQIDNLMSSLANFSNSNGVPVIIGEFGVENQNNDSDREAYIEYYMQKATQNGIRCIWWDNGQLDYGGYGILDRNTLSWNEPLTNALIDNAPSGTAAAASAPEVEETEETSASTTEQAQVETQETVQTQEQIAQQEEPAAGTAPSGTEEQGDLQNINANKNSFILLLIVGIVAVLAAYSGLFLLGRRNGRKQ